MPRPMRSKERGLSVYINPAMDITNEFIKRVNRVQCDRCLPCKIPQRDDGSGSIRAPSRSLRDRETTGRGRPDQPHQPTGGTR